MSRIHWVVWGTVSQTGTPKDRDEVHKQEVSRKNVTVRQADFFFPLQESPKPHPQTMTNWSGPQLPDTLGKDVYDRCAPHSTAYAILNVCLRAIIVVYSFVYFRWKRKEKCAVGSGTAHLRSCSDNDDNFALDGKTEKEAQNSQRCKK